MVFAVIATGLEKLTCCQPLAVSLVNVAVASKTPPLLHSSPICVPVSCTHLKKRTPSTTPATSLVNLMPKSTPPCEVMLGSATFWRLAAGADVGLKMVTGGGADGVNTTSTQ